MRSPVTQCDIHSICKTMRPVIKSGYVPSAGTGAAGKDPSIQPSPSESAIGSAAVRELVAQLSKELLPSNPISRSEFLNLPLGEREEQHVDLKTMLGLIIGAWALEKSMPIHSINHKSSAAEDYHDARSLMVQFDDTQEPKEGESDILRTAKRSSYTQTGSCYLHADRNLALIGSKLHELYDDYPALRDHLPHAEKMVDKTAGKRLGGRPDDDHAYVRIAGMADPVIVCSWVPFPETILQSQCKYEASDRPEAIYKVPDNKHDIPRDFEQQLDAINSERLEPKLFDEDRYRDRHYWRNLRGEPHRSWQIVESRRDDAKKTVYVCGDLRFDSDLMGAPGLQLRKRRAQEAEFALKAGGEQSPIRGAPRLSPLPRPEQRALPPDASESISGDKNPDPREV